MIKIRYSNHALERFKIRNIVPADIEQAIRSGAKSDAQNGTRKAKYRNKTDVLVVIYNIIDFDEVEIITAYWK